MHTQLHRNIQYEHRIFIWACMYTHSNHVTHYMTFKQTKYYRCQSQGFSPSFKLTNS